jgi:hypothetical protein
MNLKFNCSYKDDNKTSRWKGNIKLISCGVPYELEVSARQSRFHIICGKHQNGNYLCIPNWNIGTELSGFSDYFWNTERLTTYYPELSMVDVISITTALVKLSEYISVQEEAR